MIADRELLRRAWPDGFLAMRGVGTVGGYDCIPDRDGGLHWFPRSGVPHMPAGNWYSEDGTHPRIKDGDLLPNVDPTDIPTWAGVLADLATAVGQGPRWPRGLTWVMAKPYWRLMFFDRVGHTFYDIDTNDPAEALVRARIQIRETGR